MVEAVREVQSGTDKTAAELAIQRLNNELTALIMRRDQIAYQYHQHNAEGGAGAIIVGGLVACICAGIGLFFLIAGSLPFFAIWALVGVGLGLLTLIMMSNSTTRKGEELAATLARELAPVDRAIYEVKKKIIQNRSIAES